MWQLYQATKMAQRSIGWWKQFRNNILDDLEIGFRKIGEKAERNSLKMFV